MNVLSAVSHVVCWRPVIFFCKFVKISAFSSIVIFFCKYLHFILSCYMTPADPAAFLTVVCLVVLPLRIVVLQHLYCVACCLGCKRCVSLSKWNCPLFACPKSFWINLRPVETNLQMFIEGSLKHSQVGHLNMKLGWGSLEARHTASFLAAVPESNISETAKCTIYRYFLAQLFES